MNRLVPCIAAAALGLALLPGSPAAAAPRSLKPGLGSCIVNDEQPRPCEIRRGEGGLDIEIGGDEPLLALVVDDALHLFALVGEEKSRVPLIVDYSVDPARPSCWVAADADAAVVRLCVR